MRHRLGSTAGLVLAMLGAVLALGTASAAAPIAVCLWSPGNGTFTTTVLADEPFGPASLNFRDTAWIASGNPVDTTAFFVASLDREPSTVIIHRGGDRRDVQCNQSPDVVLDVSLDSEGIVANRWRGATFTPTVSGPATLVTSWDGDADVAMGIRVSATSVWVGSGQGGNGERSVTVDLVAGTDYTIGAWSRSGLADVTVTSSIAGKGPKPVPRPDPKLSPPNIVIVNLDDARRETMEVMDLTNQWFSDGTTYNNAFIATPSCCPSRATLMTGQYVHNNGQVNQTTPLTDESTSIQRYLSESGYFTGHTGKYLHYYQLNEQAPYWDEWAYFRGGYLNVPFYINGEFHQADQYSTIETFDLAADQLETFDRQDDDRPFYLHIAPVAPHSPFDVEPKFADAPVPEWDVPPSVGEVDRSDKPNFVSFVNITRAEGSAIREAQLRMMLTVDEQFDRFMQRLEQLGEADNTLVIFTSDNGYFWGEHRRRGKFLPYKEAIGVPFLVRWPGSVGSSTSDDMITHVDILPTVLGAAGVSAGHVVDGRDILDPGFSRAEIFTEYFEDIDNANSVTDWSSLRNNERVYTEYQDVAGQVIFREYYDLVNDPYELTNLLRDGNTRNNPDTSALSDALAAARNCTGAGCP